jgi:hypothetical protein
MKYENPKYEINAIETEDILIISNGYEIEQKGDGSGNVILDASNIF